jgi:hypothetical protein
MKYVGDIIIMLIGLYCALIGFRVVSASKRQGAEYEEWYKKWGSKLKIIGPVLMLIAIVKLFLR